MNTGFKLSIGDWWAYPWLHSWRQCLLLQNPLVRNSSAGKGREPWVASKLAHDWLWTDSVLCRPSAGSHSSSGVMTSLTASEDSIFLLSSSYILSASLFHSDSWTLGVNVVQMPCLGQDTQPRLILVTSSSHPCLHSELAKRSQD